MKDKLPAMSEEECLMSLNAGGMLVKRPILVARDYRIIGFKETEWADKLLRA